MGQEIAKRAGDVNSPLWSTRSMLDRPGLAEAVYRDYFHAGATIATTNTYAVHRDRLMRHTLEAEFLPLLKQGLAEATAARDAFGKGRIAGSIGPLEASYRPDLCPPLAVAAPLFAEVAEVLAAGADLLLLETVASVAHADAVLSGCDGIKMPIWLALTVSDDDGRKLRSGEELAVVLPLVATYRPAAILANCSVPEVMADALAVLARAGIPFGAYANGFTRINDAFLNDAPTVDLLEARHDLTPEVYANFAQRWVDMGATIVGGCCETGPEHIAEIARRLDRSGFEIV